ncbi:MAG: DUF4198 domain-containing protein [Desulfovibrionaceae bacterium]
MQRILLFLLMAVMAPTAVSAHSLYIQAGRYQVSPGKASPLFFCYGHHIPVDDAIRRQKLSYVHVIDPDGDVQNMELRDEKSLHSYVVDYEKPGVYVLTAETTPGYFTMWFDKKGRKRHSIKPMSAVADQASKIEMSLRSSQWTKTYVRCGKTDKPFPAAVGLPLELVSNQDVTQLKTGDVLQVQVYMDGQPYTGDGAWDATYNGFSTQAEDMYLPRSEIKKGAFKIPLDVPGRWFVRFYLKADAPEKLKGQCLQEKRTTTLVFEIPNERKRPKAEGH